MSLGFCQCFPRRDDRRSGIRTNIAEIGGNSRLAVARRRRRAGAPARRTRLRGVRGLPARTAVVPGGRWQDACKGSKRPAPRRTVELQASPDGGKTWPNDAFGPELSHLFTALTVGVLWSFRYRVKLPKKPMGDWSDAITLTIK